MVEMTGCAALGYQLFLTAADKALEVRKGEDPSKFEKLVWQKIAEANQARLHQHMVAKRGSYFFHEFSARSLAEILPEYVSKSWEVVNLLLLMDLTKTLPPEWHMLFRKNMVITPSPKAIINGWLNWNDELKAVDPIAAREAIPRRLYVEAMARVLSLVPPQFDRGSVATTDGTPVNAAVDAYCDDVLSRAGRA